MIVSIFPSHRSCDAIFVAKDTVKMLNKLNITVFAKSKYKDEFKDLDVSFLDTNEELIDKCDFAVSIGGDGTMLQVSKLASLKGKNTLGVNAGRLGFMTAIEKNELELFKSILDGNFKVEERMMIKAEVIENGKVACSSYCLNDAVISRGSLARLIDIEVTSDGREISYVRADGIIVSTPTGSTAYSMAAGGPVVSPNNSCMIVTPICPHSLLNRSIILDSNDVIDIKVNSDKSNNSYLSLDGGEAILIKPNMIVRISKSKYTAKLVKIKPDNFYEVLRKKVIERRF